MLDNRYFPHFFFEDYADYLILPVLSYDACFRALGLEARNNLVVTQGCQLLGFYYRLFIDLWCSVIVGIKKTGHSASCVRAVSRHFFTITLWACVLLFRVATHVMLC